MGIEWKTVRSVPSKIPAQRSIRARRPLCGKVSKYMADGLTGQELITITDICRVME